VSEDGASYVFAGPKGDDLPSAMEEIASLFDVKTLLLEGGGKINGAFLKHKLIDEFSTLIHPAVDGVAGAQSIVDYDGAEGTAPEPSNRCASRTVKRSKAAWCGCGTPWNGRRTDHICKLANMV
jgi:riboflavin biosynthesis pyrimidine reductase